VLGLLDKYLSEGFKTSEIILLSPKKYGCLAQIIAANPPWEGQVKEYTFKPTSLSFSTIYSFKGLESSVVLLTDIESLETNKDFDLLYVGMSRALHRLAVLFHKKVASEIKRSCII
jgi:superfamily I DNA and RNA helicase